ncbi:hypothetical protein JQ582_36110 [Bradyrhizobium japonicum]|uniref:hypothetical protein n=1 Tax=Bradyrhizobium TaxID=374 RepID=UPI0011DD5AE3|nr:hypothetical protein [Bradyrhizobium japonicum]MBR0731601.1 hypothetical protein [Bradyrhizobium japonicum]MBR0749363.1 hypothetical protein [Bradyrhizobium japonicum]MCD9112631.1 hypothetical protein [Bradyrhizobium japonicum]MCD9256934.1 hypothetical protein [Bradyrhizobium japonicum SEMIA 5079]MCD9822192.1 hypothetical protein [Bradyrhizobium japonicum]
MKNSTKNAREVVHQERQVGLGLPLLSKTRIQLAARIESESPRYGTVKIGDLGTVARRSAAHLFV